SRTSTAAYPGRAAHADPGVDPERAADADGDVTAHADPGGDPDAGRDAHPGADPGTEFGDDPGTEFGDDPDAGVGAPAYGMATLAADAVAVLDAYDVARAHVFGWGMGGLVAQLLLLDHPER